MKSLTSKKEFEMVFNGLLGTDIPWGKLPKESLVELAVLFKNPEILIQKLSKKSESPMDLTVGKLAMTVLESWDGPLLKGLKTLAGKQSGTEKG